MRRLRNISPALPPVSTGRLAAAVVASVFAHILLVYGFALPDAARSLPREIVIHAQLEAVQPLTRVPSTEAARPPSARVHPSAAPGHSSAVELVADPSDNARAMAQLSSVPTATADSGEAVLVNVATGVAPSGDEAAMTAMPDPVLYDVSELDVYPRALRPINPAYPASARDAQLAGSVTLRVMIDEGGRVVTASILDAEPGGIFDQAAHAAVTDAAFYPAQRNGRAVRSQMLIKVEFDPRSAR